MQFMQILETQKCVRIHFTLKPDIHTMYNLLKHLHLHSLSLSLYLSLSLIIPSDLLLRPNEFFICATNSLIRLHERNFYLFIRRKK